MDPRPHSSLETILRRNIEAVENSSLHVEEKLTLVLFYWTERGEYNWEDIK